MASYTGKCGTRDGHVEARNSAIEAAAMALAKAKVWPSPATVAERAGIKSPSVVKREIQRLTKARRHWIKIVGHPHPQWKDPDAEAAGEEPSSLAATEDLAAADAAEKAKRPAAKKRKSERDLRKRIAELEELVRRAALGVRPAEVQAILTAGATKRTATPN